MSFKHLKYFILSILVSHQVVGQELPPIENFTAEIYEAGNQNWAISQGVEGTMYFANNSGLLEYNGSDWKLYQSPNGSIFRSLNVINNTVFTGCYMDFGYWERNNFGALEYTSLVAKLNIPLANDEDFWDIVYLDNWVLFQSLDRIYIYNLLTDEFKIIESKTTIEIFKANNQIYFQKLKEGLFRIKNGQSELVSNHEILKEHQLVGGFQVANETVLITQQGEFYFLQNTELTKWNIPADEVLSGKNLYSSTRLDDGSFLIGTVSNGLIQIDSNGNVIKQINKEKGIYNNTVLSLFEDRDNNIWLGLDNGISSLNFNSPFTLYNDFRGELGVIYASAIYNNVHYLGTNQGLFFKPDTTSDTHFQLIKGTEGQVWSLKEIDKTLFCGHNNGTYIIENDAATLISDRRGTWEIKPIQGRENLLIQGNYEGLSILEKVDGNWKFRNAIEGFDISSRFFEFSSENQLLVNHEVSGIHTLEFNPEYTKITNKKVQGAYGYGSSLVRFNDEIIYSINSINSIFKYKVKERTFEWDSVLTNVFYNNRDKAIGPLLVEPITQKLWGFTENNIIYYGLDTFSEQLTGNRIAISKSFRRNMGVVGFENLTFNEENLYLIGASNGYIILDINKLKSQTNQIKISSITKETKERSPMELELGEFSELKHYENNLNFTFSIPSYSKIEYVQYQYKLEGFYDDWSDWQSETQVSFGNLPSGNYTFKVKGKVGNNISDNIESFEFTILKPWYLTNTLIAFYALSLILGIIIIHRVYNRYYTRERNRAIKRTYRKLRIESLEKEQELLKFKNDNLQLDVDNKNRELGMSTMNLIKKNEILNNIKKELNASQEPSHIKYVIKIIDKNLNDNDDWKLFEEAFNNADKDFFKKIKQLHPSLTPNDLRLCAYLRLNLTSKEIAPLLNISVKSVEVKRYRLRKKMNLDQEANLSRYIFEL